MSWDNPSKSDYVPFQHRHVEPGTCAKCHTATHIPTGMDPTRFCAGCADELLDELRAIALDNELERGDRLQRIVARIPEA